MVRSLTPAPEGTAIDLYGYVRMADGGVCPPVHECECKWAKVTSVAGCEKSVGLKGDTCARTSTRSDWVCQLQVRTSNVTRQMERF